MNVQKASYCTLLNYGKEEEFYEKLKLENKTVSDVLRLDDEGDLLLLAAISGKNFNIAKVLLEKGADVKKVSADGFNAFHLIASSLYDEDALAFAELLSEKGADLACQDKKYGNTAMFTLCMEALKNRTLPASRVFVCKCLMKNIGIDQPNKRGITARNVIEQRGTPEMKAALEK